VAPSRYASDESVMLGGRWMRDWSGEGESRDRVEEDAGEAGMVGSMALDRGSLAGCCCSGCARVVLSYLPTSAGRVEWGCDRVVGGKQRSERDREDLRTALSSPALDQSARRLRTGYE
jgi:hypothetical protein